MKKLLLFILLVYVVRVKAQCTVNINAQYSIICNSQKNQLIAGGATSYSWHPQFSVVSSSVSGDTVVVQPSTSTVYTVTGTTGTCTATNTVLITVNACTPPIVGFTTSTDTTCVGSCIIFKDTTQYHSTKPLFYAWAFPGGTITPVAGSSVFMDTLYYNMTNSTPLPNVKVCYHTTSGTGFFLVTEKVTNGINQTSTYTDSVMVTVCAGIEEISNANLQADVNPNPSNGIFTIETNVAEKQMVFIFDVNGKLVFNQFINGKANIDARSLNAGVYSLNITSNHGSVTKKLVIVK
jgi:hypothetical protein